MFNKKLNKIYLTKKCLTKNETKFLLFVWNNQNLEQ